MKKKSYFFLFSYSLIILSSIILLFLGGKTLLEVRNYVLLDKKTEAFITQWQIQKDKKEKYLIGASYTYYIDKKKYEGQMVFDKLKFLNYHAALNYLNKMAPKSFKAWYSSKNSGFSKLEKKMPLKNIIYTIVTFTILIYFFILIKFMQKKELF